MNFKMCRLSKVAGREKVLVDHDAKWVGVSYLYKIIDGRSVADIDCVNLTCNDEKYNYQIVLPRSMIADLMSDIERLENERNQEKR